MFTIQQYYAYLYNVIKEIESKDCSVLKTIFTDFNRQNPITVRLVVARDQDHIIGVGKNIYWNLPNDMHKFAQDTVNSISVVGNVTFHTFERNGEIKPLPKRFHLVISSKAKLYYQNSNNILLANSDKSVSFHKRVFYCDNYLQSQIFIALLKVFVDSNQPNLDQFTILIDKLKASYGLEIDLRLLTLALSEVCAVLEKFQINPNFISIIGGTSIYEQAFEVTDLFQVNQIYLTEIPFTYPVDENTTSHAIKMFKFPENKYKLVNSSYFYGDLEQKVNCHFQEYHLI